jgi:2-hydroxycyclohexanecarboxyl-CoA dehydrogenase
MSVALITGAASGIGAATARLLGRSGWRTAGLDLNVAAETELPVVVDVSDRAAVAAAVDRVAAELGGIDLVVTVAGYYEEGVDVEDISIDRWNRMLAVHLGGTVYTCAAALPYLLERGTGAIVAISSELALGGDGGGGDLHYVAAKGAVLGFAKSLALEVAHTGIRVNVVAPGPTDTPLLPADSAGRAPDYLARLPLGRLVDPEEIAYTVRYLATEGDMYCGEVLSPNAGAVI